MSLMVSPRALTRDDTCQHIPPLPPTLSRTCGRNKLTDSSKGKRIFIKDIVHYLAPPNRQKASIAPSLKDLDTEENNLPNGTQTNGTQANGIHHPNGSSSD